VIWAAWDGERDSVRGEEVRREGFFTSESASSLVVRPQWRLISTVEVCARVCHTSVAEGNCVTARWGGEQPEAKPRSAGGRTRFGEMSRRACN